MYRYTFMVGWFCFFDANKIAWVDDVGCISTYHEGISIHTVLCFLCTMILPEYHLTMTKFFYTPPTRANFFPAWWLKDFFFVDAEFHGERRWCQKRHQVQFSIPHTLQAFVLDKMIVKDKIYVSEFNRTHFNEYSKNIFIHSGHNMCVSGNNEVRTQKNEFVPREVEGEWEQKARYVENTHRKRDIEHQHNRITSRRLA